MQLSYAQNLEDYHLWTAFEGLPAGVYIDIGAGHPVADNVTFALYERGWRGIVVEPQAELARLYAAIRPRDTVVSALIGRTTGEASFHQVDRLHGFSTTIEKHAEGAKAFGAGYQTKRLPMLTLADLCERHGFNEIDVLKIDVEGAEADVLAGNDWTRFRPKVVLAEAIAPGTGEPNWAGWEPALLEQGYRFVLFDNLNRFYVAQEQTALIARFPREKADWGAVIHGYEVGRAQEPRHPDHELAMDLAKGLWASLPLLEPPQLADLIARGRGIAVEEAVKLIDSEPMRAALGRIAAGYDGGQLFDD
jgi:FkbM family methyltransferase